jgi:hypothetical protein
VQPSKAIDGDPVSKWAPSEGSGTQELDIVLDGLSQISAVTFTEESSSRVLTAHIDFWDGSKWTLLAAVSKSGGLDAPRGYTNSFTPVVAQKVRIVITSVAVPGSWFNHSAELQVFEVWGRAYSVIKSGPINQQVPKGGTAVFSVALEDDATGATIDWLFNGAPITGEHNTSLMLANVIPFFAGTYYCKVTVGGKVYYSNEALLSVEDFVVKAYFALEVEFPSSVGKIYQIQRSDDLVTWSDLGEQIVGNGTTIDKIFQAREPARFVRAKELP